MAKNGPKWPKFVCHTLYFRNHRSYDVSLWYTCMYKRITSPGFLFFFTFFFKILIFRIIKWEVVKWQKMAQNDKKFCLPHSVSQELCIIWLWFLVHKCKMMKVWFLGVLGRWNGKKWLKIGNFSMCCSISQEL